MLTSIHDHIVIQKQQLHRRRFLRTVAGAALATGTLNFGDMLALQAEELRRQGRAMILLWMAGGPSQMETFDPKPGHENGGGTKSISTSVSGIKIAEGWEKTAAIMHECTLIRSLNNKEGNHERAAYQMHTGYVPSGSVKHPSLGSNIARELADPNAELPSIVTIGRNRGIGAGFLGVNYDPFVVDSPGTMPRNVSVQTQSDRYLQRMKLMSQLEKSFAQKGGAVAVEDHHNTYQKTSDMVLSPDVNAFDISKEPEALKAKYGTDNFGKGCLLARRLVEKGVSFVEVRMDGWDTHDDNFDRVTTLAGGVDPGMSALITDLKDRGMLDSTLVVWMGEFGRSPKVNPRGGRDHFPRAFNALMAGGGVKGGQVIGETSADGNDIVDAPVSVPDMLRSVCHSLQVNADKENISPLGRPMKIVDGGQVIPGLFG